MTFLTLISSTRCLPRGWSGTPVPRQPQAHQTQGLAASSQPGKGRSPSPGPQRPLSPHRSFRGAGTSPTRMIKAPCHTAVAVFSRGWRKPRRTPGAGHNTAPQKISFKKLSRNPINQLEGQREQPSSGLINNGTCPVLEGVALSSELGGCDKPCWQEETDTTPLSLKPPWVWHRRSPS